MTTGILTFHNTLNYGAQLQAFALQSVLARMGQDVEIIDYRNVAVTARETPLKPGLTSLVRHPRGSVRGFPAYGDLMTRAVKFRKFAESAMRIGPQLQEAEDIARRYQTIVVGSDQVWNPVCTGGDLSYFLDDRAFADTLKVSYAASFGSGSFPQEYAERCGEAFRGFNAISVREESGIEIVRSLSQRDAKLVLDPTLLLERSEWADLGKGQGLGRYVFVYMVGERKRTFQYAREEAKRRGVPLVAIDCYRRARHMGGCTFRNGASIEEFLGLIRDADLVVTSSFHGLALSIALETDVRYCLNPAKGNRNSRLETLALVAGLQDCNITNGNVDGDIDFFKVRGRLEDARSSSLEFLSGAFA